MLKHQFDLMCQLIRPEQVISITIAENNDTPDQSNLFFSKFDILQFINLRSFAIISSDQSIFRQLSLLCQFNNFQSLTLPHISSTYWCHFGSQVEIILPRLRQLITNQCPLSKPLNNLKYLTVTHCYCYNLGYLFRQMPNLSSLNITISLDVFTQWSEKVSVMNYLRRLILCIDYGRLTMGRMNQFLSKLPCLMHFELQITDPIDIVGGTQWTQWSRHLNVDVEDVKDIIDGHQWKYSVSHLQTFDFRFCLSHKSSEQILDSFRSSFWLEQKQWFVAYDDHQSSPCLFTVPRFAPKNIIYSSNYRTLPCTSSDLYFDQFVDILTLPTLCPLKHRFINVTSLVSQTYNTISLDQILPFLQLPRLQSLAFVNAPVLTKNIFQSIRSLTINRTVMKYSAEQICIVFPRLERLYIKIDDPDTMLLLIDRLKHVSIVTFVYCQSSLFKDLTHEWFIQNSTRLMANNNFTCHKNGDKIHLWMDVT
ncbi:unnamed protein product [Rotaria sordida]|nr:unnamed protein product [Rotaria sordida]CAF0890296.1 unnamed protein product [Rotaria sordida]CAF1154096.1 unnamed protein product [Rotaria sordida]